MVACHKELQHANTGLDVARHGVRDGHTCVAKANSLMTTELGAAVRKGTMTHANHRAGNQEMQHAKALFATINVGHRVTSRFMKALQLGLTTDLIGLQDFSCPNLKKVCSQQSQRVPIGG